MKLLVAAGARPNFIKVAPIIRAARAAAHEVVFVHTGQHHDAFMSEPFFRDLALPNPDYFLGVGAGTHAEQTARVLLSFEPVVERERPDWIVVVGDVNSTLGCALAASKLEEATGSRIAHVEAGLRSEDWSMPEEINRVLTDRLSHLLLTPSAEAEHNLLREGIPASRIRFVGNTMIDSLLVALPLARERAYARILGLAEGKYAVVTLHRPATVDDPIALAVALDALQRIATDLPVVFPVHPRTRLACARYGLDSKLKGLRVIDPLGYVDMLSLTQTAAGALTDSGGVQEETSVLGVPCLTLRANTERPITLSQGTNTLGVWPLESEGIAAAFHRILHDDRSRRPAKIDGWDGAAAQRVVAALSS